MDADLLSSLFLHCSAFSYRLLTLIGGATWVIIALINRRHFAWNFIRSLSILYPLETKDGKALEKVCKNDPRNKLLSLAFLGLGIASLLILIITLFFVVDLVFVNPCS